MTEKIIELPVEKVMVTERVGSAPDKMVLQTPSVKTANVEIVAVTWWKQTLIRTTRTYLQSLVGSILAVGTGAASAAGINIPAKDFIELFISCASLAVAPAVISLLQNTVEILSRLDVTNPTLRA